MHTNSKINIHMYSLNKSIFQDAYILAAKAVNFYLYTSDQHIALTHSVNHFKSFSKKLYGHIN